MTNFYLNVKNINTSVCTTPITLNWKKTEV